MKQHAAALLTGLVVGFVLGFLLAPPVRPRQTPRNPRQTEAYRHLLHQHEALKDQYATLEDLARHLEGTHRSLSRERTAGGPDWMREVEASVSGVDEDLNIVMLDAGRDRGVEKGYSFTVHRGTRYVATVIIDSVEAAFSTGYSRKELEAGPIQVGDSATTKF